MKSLMSILLSVMLLASPASVNAIRASHNRRNHHVTVSHPAPVSTQIGLASWYGPEMCIRSGSKGKRSHYRKMANGQPFDPSKLTAASRTLPFGSKVRVTNIRTRQSVIVTITDRGPFTRNRILDLAEAAAHKIKCDGVCYVRLDWDMPDIMPVEPAEIVSEVEP